MKQRERRAERRRLKAMAWRDRREYVVHRREERLGLVRVYEFYAGGMIYRQIVHSDGSVTVLSIVEACPPAWLFTNNF